MPEIFDDIEQRSPDWFALRAGTPTASEFHKVIMEAKGKDGKKAGTESKTRMKYMRQLAGERITGEPMETYRNWHMERGQGMEPDALNFYAFMVDAEPHTVGLIRNGEAAASPDALVGNDGMLELKTALPDILIEKIEADQFPPEHKAQCQGQLWVAEREWVDLAIYWPGMPMFIKRAYRDEEYIAHLSEAIDKFNAELQAMVERVQAYSSRAAA